MVAALAVFAGTAVAAAPASALTGGWQRGISIQSRWNTDFASDSFKQSIRNAKADGVNTVTLVIPVHQDNIYTSNVYAAGDTPTDDAIASGLSYIKAQGMAAGIAIHDNPYDGQWRAFINPGDTQSWFNSYGALVTRYAGVAQSAGATSMIIGTELSTMTQSQFTGNWNAIIKNVRAKFGGSLTYSAQHAGFKGEVSQIGFWGNLDYVGISAYYTLYGRTDQAGMESAWKDWDSSEIAPIAAKTGKKVIFTEVGFVSRDGATDEPGSGYNLNTGTNTALQATAYKALFNYWSASSTPLAGIYLWDWSSDPSAGGSGNRDFTPQGKPAEAVMKDWYTGASSGTTAPGSGTTTPTQPSAPTAYSAALNGSGTATTGSQVAATVGVSVNNPQSGMIVNIEIYNAGGARVAQTVYDNQSLGTAAKSYALNWTPSANGTYTVKAGVFTGGWGSNPYWNNGLGTITVSAPATTTPPTTGGTTPGSGSGGSTTPIVPTQPTAPAQPSQSSQPSQPAQPAQPTQPSAPAQPATVNIWWPGDGVTVSGVQPFKAVVDGRDAATYDIYWQVDGGQLNKLGEKTDPVTHKESDVILTGWNWQPSHKYVINFVAKDKAGAVLAQKAATILIY